MSIYRTSRSYGSDRYYAGESDLVVVPRTWKYDQSLPGVVYLHGRSGSALDAAELNTNGRGLFNIVNTIGARYPIVAADLGGQGTWGHPSTQQARTADAITYLRNVIGCSSAPVALVGSSMGGLGALNFSANHRSEVACVAGIVPVVNLDQIRKDTGYYTEINPIWGVPNNQTPLPIEADPTTNYAAFSGLPIKLWYSSSDIIVRANNVTDFANLVNGSTVLVGAYDHEDVSKYLDPEQIVDFISTYLDA